MHDNFYKGDVFLYKFVVKRITRKNLLNSMELYKLIKYLYNNFEKKTISTLFSNVKDHFFQENTIKIYEDMNFPF